MPSLHHLAAPPPPLPLPIAGDTAPVKVGRNSSVLDAAKVSAGVQIGDDCIICPAATLSTGVVIEDGAMIGAGAVLQPGVKVGKDAFVDAGAVVPANTTIPAGQLWTGVPARHLRDLSTDEMAYLRSSALHYATLATRHAAECAKTVQEVEYDTYLADWKAWMHMDAKEELPTVDPYMVQYYQLSRGQSVSQDQGLFREKEYDDGALRQAKLEAEVQSDLAEDEYYADLASLDRVGAAVAALAGTPVHMTVQRDDILTDLEHTDERAAAFMQDLLARAAAAADDEAAAADVLDDLRSLDSNKDSLARGMDAELQLSQLAAHARTLKHGLPAMPRVAAYLEK